MPPVLYIIFNRPDLTERSFATIRKAQPERLYVVADAPRPDHNGEAERCQQAREVTANIDWECDVRRLYADTNMGCGRRIGSAITSVLEDHEDVIILEDDCIPDPSFFEYCTHLLQRYRDDTRVMAISGDHFQGPTWRSDHSYYFSKYPHCWGWATWRRAWNHFDLSMQSWPDFRDSDGLHAYCETQRELRFWRTVLDQTHSGQIDTWDLQWTLSCWLQHGLTILPSKNLVSNVGFRNDGTHTKGSTDYANLPTSPLAEWRHPEQVVRNALADRYTDELLYSGPWQRSQKRRNPISRMKRSLLKRVG